jgi:aspartate racemase
MENAKTSTSSLSASKRGLLEKLRSGACQAPQLSQAIRRRSAHEGLPLSFAQQRLWLLQQWNPDSTAYNISGAIRLRGRLDIAALEQSLSVIVERHEILRTTFAVVDQQPVQVVAEATPLRLKVVDLQDTDAEGREGAARRIAVEEANQPFDLTAGPLVRAGLVRLGAHEHILLLSMHHTVFDGWSQNLLIEELSQGYEAFSQGRKPDLAPLPIQYGDFALWQRRQGASHLAQLGYWTRQLGDASVSTGLPTDFPRPPRQTFHGARHSVPLAPTQSEALREIARTHSATMFMLLLAAFQALLYRYTGQNDIIIGTPVAGRQQPETEKLIGVFINMLTLRTRVAGDMKFTELLRRARETTLEAYANQDVPFERVVEELNPPRDLSRSPIFQIAYAWQGATASGFRLAGLEARPLEVESGRARFDLTLFMLERSDGLAAALAYNLDLFKPETIHRMLQHFSILLGSIVESPDARVDDLALLTEAEARLLGKDTSVDLAEVDFAF